MVQAILALIVLGAFAAWCVAVWSALQVVLLAPKGARMAAYWNLGWWKHAQIMNDVGPQAGPHLARYRKAFIAFFACVLAGMFGGFLLALTAQNGGGA